VIAYKKIRFSKLFVFEADLIYIPKSLNRKGIDPLPKYHLRPTKLLEYQDFSYNPSSVNNGYVKSKNSNLYVKNIDFVDVDFVSDLFNFIKKKPPYGFTSEIDYEEFVETTFDFSYSNTLGARYNAKSNQAVFVKENIDPLITVEHLYVKTEASKIQSFYNTDFVKVGKHSSVNVFNSNV
tara:strand:- start:314 stop:853 length:540 start_codon:yes stop_codon:yes gene_type:complete